MASLWVRSGCDMKVDPSVETYQVGAHFKALIKAILVPLSRILENFFSFFVSLPRCAQARMAKTDIFLKTLSKPSPRDSKQAPTSTYCTNFVEKLQNPNGQPKPALTSLHSKHIHKGSCQGSWEGCYRGTLIESPQPCYVNHAYFNTLPDQMVSQIGEDIRVVFYGAVITAATIQILAHKLRVEHL